MVVFLACRDFLDSLTVISTSGIANVGQGGLLFEYTDQIIDKKYRQDLREQILASTFSSIESQRKYLKQNWKRILDQYLQIHPEFKKQVDYPALIKDLTGFSVGDIPYEMGDYMPVFLIDEEEHLKFVYDKRKQNLLALDQKDGRPTKVKVFDSKRKEVPRISPEGKPKDIPYFDKEGNKVGLYDEEGKEIPPLVVFKIEANPGAGLWKPHDDQLPPERKGEGVFTIFSSLGERAKSYKEKISSLR